jgi:putative tricarboxylic transport membrane protein
LFRNVWRGLLTAGAVAAFAAVALAQGEIRITIPSSPGSGWDQAGRFIRLALLASGAVQGVEVANVPGAGGTIGLAEFVENARKDGNELLVTGLAMISATLVNKSRVTLDQVTPIARLTSEYLVIMVRPESPLRTVEDLAAAVQADPARVTWAGGAAGSVDQIAAALFAKAVNADTARIGYVPFLSGAEAVAAIVEGAVAVGIGTSGDFEDHIKAGKLRALAVTAPARLDGIDAPTLQERGIPVELGNWRGVVGPPGITSEQRATLIDAVEAMRRSPAWVEALRQKNWQDAYLAGNGFDVFLREEQDRLAGVLMSLGLLR